MLPVTELRAGTTFEDHGEIYQVLVYEHIKTGRGSANVKVKVRNLRSGAVTEKSFISRAQAKEITLNKKQLQFLYQDSNLPAGRQGFAYFMNPKSFEQVNIPLKVIPLSRLLKAGDEFEISFNGEEPLELILPPKMEFKVAETGPSLRGNSATNIYKDARLENGLKIKVPLFIKTGDRILIDTRTLEYSQKK